jgi:F-type H+-transporting ATPase subunit b
MTIDWWTLGIQTVNVAVLVWLLQRFFWRPVAAMIEQRRDATRRTMAEAEATRTQATAALAEIERTRAGFAKERDAILAAAHAESETTRTALLAEARTAAAALETTARTAIEKANQAAGDAWKARSARLAVAIAEQLAARLDGAAVRVAFLDWLVQEVGALPDAARRAVMASGAALEVVSATVLDPAEQQRTRQRIGEALGGDPSIVFRTDPALIAGLELRGAHLLVSNSWRADLDQILLRLTQGAETNDVVSPSHPGSDQPVCPKAVTAAPAEPNAR